MKTPGVVFNERSLMQHMTVHVRVERSAAHRFLLWVGMKFIALGVRLIGANVAIEDARP